MPARHLQIVTGLAARRVARFELALGTTGNPVKGGRRDRDAVNCDAPGLDAPAPYWSAWSIRWRPRTIRCGRRLRIGGYSLPATVLKVVLIVVPINVNEPMAATAISAAIRLYSMAVTPRSSFSNEVRTFISISCS